MTRNLKSPIYLQFMYMRFEETKGLFIFISKLLDR